MATATVPPEKTVGTANRDRRLVLRGFGLIVVAVGIALGAALFASRSDVNASAGVVVGIAFTGLVFVFVGAFVSVVAEHRIRVPKILTGRGDMRAVIGFVGAATLGYTGDQARTVVIARRAVEAGTAPLGPLAAVVLAPALSPVVLVSGLVAFGPDWRFVAWVATTAIAALAAAWGAGSGLGGLAEHGGPPAGEAARDPVEQPQALPPEPYFDADTSIDALVRKLVDRTTGGLRALVVGAVVIGATQFVPSSWAEFLVDEPLVAVALAIALAVLAAPGPYVAAIGAVVLAPYGVGVQVAFGAAAVLLDRHVVSGWARGIGIPLTARLVAACLPLIYAAGVWTEVVI